VRDRKEAGALSARNLCQDFESSAPVLWVAVGDPELKLIKSVVILGASTKIDWISSGKQHVIGYFTTRQQDRDHVDSSLDALGMNEWDFLILPWAGSVRSTEY
jgi:hypothetical protein